MSAPMAAPLAARDGGVTRRVVILCLALAALFGYVIPIVDYKLFNTFLGGTHLPPGAIATLLVLLLIVNPLLRLVSRRAMFTRNETLVVYVSCLFSCLIPGHGSEAFIIPNLLAPFYFANRQNHWLHWLTPTLKPWLTPAMRADGSVNSRVVDGWFMGVGPGGAIPWSAWLVPLAFWGGLALISYFMLACLALILRKQWGEYEALSFPLLRLPLELTQGMDDNPRALPEFFCQPAMWVGFGIAAFIQLVNGLNLYYPDVPPIRLTLDMGPYLADVPWNQIGGVKVSIFPIAVGIAFLLTSEISLSLWFFLWYFKSQLIGAYLLGYMPTTLPDATGALPGKLFQGFQMGGAYLTYTASIAWMARRHLKHVLRRALGRERAGAEEAAEAMSYPFAFWGFAVSFSLMVAATVATGVRLDIALALWAGYIVFAVGLTRVAVEGGLLFLLHFSYPLGVIGRLLPFGGNSWLSLENGAIPASLFQSGFVFHMRAFLMPSFMQSFKLAYDQKINARHLGLLLAGVTVISLIVSWPNLVRLGYETGGLSLGHKWFAQQGSLSSMKFASSVLKSDRTSVAANWWWLAVGVATTWLLMLGRARFAWFPFHPLGYLMGLSYPISVFWFSIFLGWVCKCLINRCGGTDSVRRLTPLFLGLALGDVAMMLFWLLVDGATGRTGHLLMPG